MRDPRETKHKNIELLNRNEQMSMKRHENSMRMPTGYVLLTHEEMELVDGGGTLTIRVKKDASYKPQKDAIKENKKLLRKNRPNKKWFIV